MNMPIIESGLATNHPWIEDHLNYEAVLVCNNTLNPREHDSVIRAFQTFLFKNISRDNDSVEVCHNDTGSIIQYDGNVAAIRFSDNIEDMLPDLVSTLHALGWRNVSAYHDTVTIAMFLEDLGRAIPANMDFDVQPAALSDDPGHEFPEGRMMLSRNINLNLNEQIDIIGEELGLSDDDLNHSALKLSTAINLDPSLFERLEDKIILSPMHLKQETASSNANNLDIPIPEIPVSKTRGIVDSKKTALPFKSATINSNQVEKSVEPRSIFKLGNGYFCFDMPGIKFDGANLIAFGEEFSDPEFFTHVFPGNRNHKYYWDFMGEITTDSPAAALSLARCFTHDALDIKLMASVIMYIKKTETNGKFRDVFDTVIKLGNRPTENSLLSGVNGSTSLLNMIQFSNYRNLSDMLLKEFGDMAFLESGELITDCEFIPDHPCFTLSALKANKDPWVFVLHVRESDLDHAKNIAKILYGYCVALSL